MVWHVKNKNENKKPSNETKQPKIENRKKQTSKEVTVAREKNIKRERVLGDRAEGLWELDHSGGFCRPQEGLELFL